MPTRKGNVLFDADGAIPLVETTTPTAESGIGKFYTKNDDRLYFQDGAGNEIEVAQTAAPLAEFFVKGNGTATTITTVNDPVALQLGAGIHLKDWTFEVGKNGVITNTADNAGTLRITDATHGLATGDIVTVNGLATAAQNGITTITKIDDNTFDCDDISYVTASETGVWEMGSYLLCPTGGAGNYRCMFTTSVLSSGVNKSFSLEVIVNITAQDNLIKERKFSSTDIGSMGTGGILTAAVADRIWVCIIALTSSDNITLKHFNLNLNRI